MNVLALGIMSGTSLDGIDLALCRFSDSENRWRYEIIEAQTFGYSADWIGQTTKRTVHECRGIFTIA